MKTPYYILDERELVRSINGFQNALALNFTQYVIGYSVKTNSLPYAMKLAKENGCYAEVVSSDEYSLAKECGFSSNRIVYNGPMKDEDTFIDAIVHGGFVNIETHRELEWLCKLPKDRTYNVGIRLNINITKVSPEDADGDNDNSRFGFSEDTDEFNSAICKISKMQNVRLAGLHIHRTAHSRSIRFYQESIRFACQTIKKYNLQLDYLDVGGGYYGIFPNKPTYKQYADAFKEILYEYGQDRLCVIVEPGNALVASCFSFVTSVIDVKHVESNLWFVTTDGSRNDIDPFFKKNHYLYNIISDKTNKSVSEQIVSGCTCLEYDRMFILKDSPLLSVGDRVIYNNVGAYTMCLSPLFIRYFPSVYLKRNEVYELIRDRWTANECFQKSK